MAFTKLTSCCGLSLEHAGLIIGYWYLFMPIFVMKFGCNLLAIVLSITLILSVPWLYGVLGVEPTFMYMSLVWTKFLVAISAMLFITFSLMALDGFLTNDFPRNTDFFLYCSIVLMLITVLEWFVASVMNSLYKNMKETERALNPHDDVENDETNTFQPILSNSYIERPLLCLEKCTQKLNEIAEKMLLKFDKQSVRDDPPPYDAIWNDYSTLIVQTDTATVDVITNQPNEPNQSL
ncbi:uncharacterized protein LOC116350550 [Contarinia nasturtii]|uniref:uncharacterized protein LOC116350550 n=1 Tax=Contarinia nasturtii TaxID=265458 RepID=UPI0012D4AB46|nr:uncharacterized protein LOC116350550 [Contarinia nasturtii]XP_031638216.1 uncharacterized protein LOC116350550 [Contarinia nasturtii]